MACEAGSTVICRTCMLRAYLQGAIARGECNSRLYLCNIPAATEHHLPSCMHANPERGMGKYVRYHLCPAAQGRQHSECCTWPSADPTPCHTPSLSCPGHSSLLWNPWSHPTTSPWVLGCTVSLGADRQAAAQHLCWREQPMLAALCRVERGKGLSDGKE